APDHFDPDITILRPTEFPKPLPKCLDAGTSIGGALVTHEHANFPQSLLRPCRKRPCRRRAADKRYEVAAVHSVTPSARARSEEGTSTPSSLAVMRFMTRSNFVTCWTGRSAGFAPLRMRPA